MKHVGMGEAKTNLSELVEEVEKGDTVIITRDGKPVAKLVRAQSHISDAGIARRHEALRNLRHFANEIKINATAEEIKSWINEGRH